MSDSCAACRDTRWVPVPESVGGRMPCPVCAERFGPAPDPVAYQKARRGPVWTGVLGFGAVAVVILLISQPQLVEGVLDPAPPQRTVDSAPAPADGSYRLSPFYVGTLSCGGGDLVVELLGYYEDGGEQDPGRERHANFTVEYYGEGADTRDGQPLAASELDGTISGTSLHLEAVTPGPNEPYAIQAFEGEWLPDRIEGSVVSPNCHHVVAEIEAPS